MKAYVGLITALVWLLGSPALAAACMTPAQDTSCCCTPAGETTADACPMVKSAPSPMSAVLPARVSVAPDTIIVTMVPIETPVSATTRFIRVRASQSPPERTAFRLPSAQRGPPVNPA